MGGGGRGQLGRTGAGESGCFSFAGTSWSCSGKNSCHRLEGPGMHCKGHGAVCEPGGAGNSGTPLPTMSVCGSDFFELINVSSGC